MNLIHVVILGIIEGITEFLPISSTAHLIIASKLLNIPQTEFQKFFEVFIQSGAILAVVLLYIQYIKKNSQVVKQVLISFIPTAVVGLILHKLIKGVFFESFYLIIGALFLVGLLFIGFEQLVNKRKIKLTRSIGKLTVIQAIIIGIVQSLAVIPGVSRAGAVMLGMMFLGFKRDESAVYSFLLAIPTILSAGLFDLYQSRTVIFANLDNFWLLAVGTIVSFISAYFSVKWLIEYLKKNSLIEFGIYRMVASLFLFVL